MLSHLHAVIGNWGWSIIALVILLKLVLYPLSAAQYKSREDAQAAAAAGAAEGALRRRPPKYQAAMMELYKKEKIIRWPAVCRSCRR